MTKKEILEVLNNKRVSENSKLLKLYDYCADDDRYEKLFNEIMGEYPDLRRQYEVEHKAEVAYDDFKERNECIHQIRKKVYIDDGLEDMTGENYYYACVFCGQIIPVKKSNADWFSKHFYNNCVYFNKEIDGNILDLIMMILKDKDDDEEIDFVEELKKINLDSSVCVVNDDKRPQNYVMIIDDLEPHKIMPKEVMLLINELSKIENIRVQLLSKSISFEGLKYGSFAQNGYIYPEDLCIGGRYGVLDVFRSDKKYQIPFKLIINLSPNLTIYDVVVQDKIGISDVLCDMFPNSIIINVTKLNEDLINELSNYIKTMGNGEAIDEYKNIKRLVMRK